MGALVQGNLALGEVVEIDVHFQEQDSTRWPSSASDMLSGFEFLGMTSEECAQIAAIISRTPEPSSARRLCY
jgi:hypothetical protein